MSTACSRFPIMSAVPCEPKPGSSKKVLVGKEGMGNPRIKSRKAKMGGQSSILKYFKREPVKRPNATKLHDERMNTQKVHKKQHRDHEMSSSESDEDEPKPRTCSSEENTLEYDYTREDFESMDTDKEDMHPVYEERPKKKAPIRPLTRIRQTRKDPTDLWKKLSRERGLRDTEDYRNNYPNKRDDLTKKDNLLFYTNQKASAPRGDLIDAVHKLWYGDYQLLENHHGYIQWLFPIRESGMNYRAQELQLHEAEAIKKDPVARARVLKSYKLMLHFYGMELTDELTGEIRRGLNWVPRFRHLNRSTHNYLRITRILKSLGELGCEHLKPGWVLFLLKESLIETEEGYGPPLSRCADSCVNYWIGTLRDREKREQLYDYAEDLMQQQ